MSYSYNASSHTSVWTNAFLISQNIDFLSHPPFSSDWASNVKNRVVNFFQLLHLKYLNQSGKSASKIGSDACKSLSIFMGNILNHKYKEINVENEWIDWYNRNCTFNEYPINITQKLKILITLTSFIESKNCRVYVIFKFIIWLLSPNWTNVSWSVYTL